jgi:O-antigen/teichoic acid export membrane protein
MRRNLIANIAGTGWSIVLQLAFTPIWLRLLGAEAYGLIGFQLLVVGLCAVFDAGLSPAINREAARLLVGQDSAPRLGGLSRSAVGALAAIGLLVAVAVSCGSQRLACSWLEAPTLPPEQVGRCVVMTGWMAGLLIAGNAPTAILQGLEAQLSINVVRIVCATAANVAAAVLISSGQADIAGWFACQLIATAMQYILLIAALLRALPSGSWSTARFDPAALRPMARFAARMGVIAAAGVVLTQVDRLILSRMLDLASFGWYTLATVAANGIRLLAMPVFTAVYPRFTSCLQRHDLPALLRLHQRSTQALALLVIPPAALLVIAPHDLLLSWTQRPEAADGAAPILRLLTIGAFFNAFLHVPYAVQLAAGWTTLALASSLVSIAVMVPGVVLAAQAWGVTGAACAWPILNAATALVVVPLVHRRFLLGSAWKWGIQLGMATGAGAAAAAATLAALRLAWGGGHALAGLIVAGGMAFALLAALYYFRALGRDPDIAQQRNAPGPVHTNG